MGLNRARWSKEAKQSQAGPTGLNRAIKRCAEPGRAKTGLITARQGTWATQNMQGQKELDRANRLKTNIPATPCLNISE